MNIENAKESLLDLKRVFDDFGCRFWLSDGTLLGCIREQNFISHDPDIDVSIFIEEWNDDILNKLKDDGFNLKYRFGVPEYGMEIAIEKRGIKIDLMFYYSDTIIKDEENNSLVWHSLWERDSSIGGKMRKMIRCTYKPFRLVETNFLDTKFWIPGDTETHLIRKYGENWKIPVKEWDWANDPLNAEKVAIFIPYTLF